MAYTRKEQRDHGEGGLYIGAPMKGARVLIIDDVISAGTSVRESVELIRAGEGEPIGVCISFDWQEQGRESKLSAVQEVQNQFGFPAFSIATTADILSYLDGLSDAESMENAEKIQKYLEQYGTGRESPFCSSIGH